MKLLNTFSTRLNKEQKEKVNEAFEIAMKKIQKKFWNKELEKVVIDVKVPYRRTGRNVILGGWFNMIQPNMINVCTQAVKADWYNVEELAKVIIHELGHLIHFNALRYEKYTFSTEFKTSYANANYREDFAECFVDFICETQATKRAAEMKELLKDINEVKDEVKKEKATLKSRVYVVGSKHLTAKGMIEITRIFVENGVEMIEYKNLETGKISVNKKVNLVSNIRKYATRTSK